MSNWLAYKKRRDVLTRLLAGESVRSVASSAGVSKVTVSKYRRLIEAIEFAGGDARLPHCECGQPSGHQGWCRVRYAKSKTRQETMRRLQLSRKRSASKTPPGATNQITFGWCSTS